MFYATHDAEDDKITAGAHVSAFATRAEAEAFLLSMYGNEWDKSQAEFKPGWFTDYWAQSHNRPDFSGLAGNWCEPFTEDQLRVNPPGSHPGGPFYWIEPTPEILIVTGIFEKEDAE